MSSNALLDFLGVQPVTMKKRAVDTVRQEREKLNIRKKIHQ